MKSRSKSVDTIRDYKIFFIPDITHIRECSLRQFPDIHNIRDRRQMPIPGYFPGSGRLVLYPGMPLSTFPGYFTESKRISHIRECEQSAFPG